jgi:hypothetical protein
MTDFQFADIKVQTEPEPSRLSPFPYDDQPHPLRSNIRSLFTQTLRIQKKSFV